MSLPAREADYPLYLYVYGEDGKHSGRQRIDTSVELEAAIVAAKGRTTETRITDTGDNLCFHMRGGRLLWPTREALGDG